MSNNEIRIIAAAALLVLSADLSAAADAPCVDDSAVPASTCTKPDMPQDPSSYQIKSFNRSVKEYGKCVQDYSDARTASIKKHEEIAKANQAAAQKVIDDYNAFNNSLKDKNEQNDDDVHR